jgi:hypothetical protein
VIAETQEFLRNEIGKLDHSGISELEISISSTGIQACAWSHSKCRYRIGAGKTIEEAFAELRKQLPDTEAQQLRIEAAEMVERADRLEGKK